MPSESNKKELALSPIGYIRSGLRTKFDTPHQPSGKKEQYNTIELLPSQQFEQALEDLQGFDRVWLIWWFHKNSNWKPKVLPPRGQAKKRGLFSTRSPHRPNPIGITAVKLFKVSGLKIVVGEVDLVDGTPILDIKPYLPEVDSFPDSHCGWLSAVQESYQQEPSYQVELSTLAKTQLNWLKEEWQINFCERAFELLARDPSVHRTRRISKYKDHFRMGCGAWRLYFKINNKTVLIERVSPGFPQRLLLEDGYSNVPDREAQVAFCRIWVDS